MNLLVNRSRPIDENTVEVFHHCDILFFLDIKLRTWIDAGKDMHYCKVVVNAAFNLRVPLAMKLIITIIIIANSMAYETQRFKIAFTRAPQ